MTAEEYWASEGVRLLNQDGTILTVEQRVKEAFMKGQEESRTWHSHYRDEASKAQKCKQAYIELEKEVARLREALKPFLRFANGIPDNWPEQCILRFDQRNDGSLYINYYGVHDASDGITIKQWRELARLAPAPQEPVIQDSRITEPVPLEPEKQLPAGYKGTRRWDEEPTIAKPATVETTCKEPLQVEPEWRELGPDEVIGADDEYNPASLGEWIKVPHGWIGEKCDITKIRTRRPLCPNDAPKQEEMPLETPFDLDIEGIEEVANHPLEPRVDFYTRQLAAHSAHALRYLRDEIQGLKEAR